MDFDLTLSESLAVCAYRCKLKPHQHQLLSEWLGAYTYVLPDERVLRESALYIPPVDNSHASYMALWNLTQILETNYSSSEQSNIIRYIQCYMPKPKIYKPSPIKSSTHESRISPTHLSSLYIPAHENSNSTVSNPYEKVTRVKVNLSRFRMDKS